METPKAMAQIVWINTTMPWTLERSIQARIAGEALSMDYLKKIREDASAAYTCGALSRFFLADDGYHVGQLIAYCPMKPEKKDIAVKILNEAPIDLTEKCDAEVLEKIKKTMIKNYEDDLKTNNYWNEIVFDNYLMHQDNDTQYRSLVESQTPEQISAFFKEFLAGAKKVSVVMLPKE